MKRRSPQKHHWPDLDSESQTATGGLVLWPTSTYIPSNHVAHTRFENNPNSSFFHLFLSLFLPVVFPLSVLISVLFLHAGPQLADGSVGFTVWQKLDGGEWKRSVPESEESATFMPHSPTSPPALRQIAPAGTRSDSLSAAPWKHTHCLTQRSFNKLDLCFFSIALQGWIPFRFPWKTTVKRTLAMKCVRVKFAVTGEPTALKHLKVQAAGNTVTHIICSIFFRRVSAFSHSLVSWCYLATVSGFIRPPVLKFKWISLILAIFNENNKHKNVPEMILIPSDTCMTNHKLKKASHPVILELDVTPNSQQHHTV